MPQSRLKIIGDRLELDGQLVGTISCPEGTLRKTLLTHLACDEWYEKGLRQGYENGVRDAEGVKKK